jgi:hypothetical protein
VKTAITRILFGLGLCAVGFYGCNRDEVDPVQIAEITVLDEFDRPVPAATIHIQCESSDVPPRPCIVERTGVTDVNGLYTTEFDEALSILVTAQKYVIDTIINGIPGDPDFSIEYVQDSICGETYIAVQPDAVSAQTVYVYECN